MDAMHRTCSRLYFNFLIIVWDHLDVVHLQSIYFGPISSNCIFRCHIIAAFKIIKNNFKYIKYDHLFSSREGDPHRPVNISGGSERDTQREREEGGSLAFLHSKNPNLLEPIEHNRVTLRSWLRWEAKLTTTSSKLKLCKKI